MSNAPQKSLPEISFPAWLQPPTRILRATGIVTVARAAGAGFGLLVSLLLTRTLPQETVGQYFTLFALAAIAALVAGLGYPSITARVLSHYDAARDPSKAIGFIHRARRQGLLAAFGFAIAGTIAGLTLVGGEVGQMCVAAAWTVPAITLTRLQCSLAVVRRYPILGYVPETLGRPLLLLAGIGILFALTGTLTGLTAMLIAFAAAWFIALIIGLRLRAIGVLDDQQPHRPSSQNSAELGSWLRQSLPLIPPALAVDFFLDATLIIAALWLHASDIAVAAIALRLAFLGGFPTKVLMQISVPDIAYMHARAQFHKVLSAIIPTACAMLVITIANLIACIVFGKWLLSLFGEDFERGYTLLVWFAAAQIVRIPGTISRPILILAGRQNLLSLWLMGVLIVLATVSSLTLPVTGLDGLAVPVLAATTVFSAGLAIFAWRYLDEGGVR